MHIKCLIKWRVGHKGKVQSEKLTRQPKPKRKKPAIFMGSNDKIYEKKILANLFLKTLP